LLDPFEDLARSCSEVQGSVVIYAGKKEDVNVLTSRLKSAGLSVTAYHAGLGEAARVQAQNSWMNGQSKIIVATVAFGMGVDKADVRLVAHWTLPKSLEAYYQEAGRAGRDGKPSQCVLYYSRPDLEFLQFVTRKGIEEAAAKRRTNGEALPSDMDRESDLGGEGEGQPLARELVALIDVSKFAENVDCRRLAILKHFGEISKSSSSSSSSSPSSSSSLSTSSAPTLYCRNASGGPRQICDVCEDIKAAEKTAILMIHGGKLPGASSSSTSMQGGGFGFTSGLMSSSSRGFTRSHIGSSNLSLMEELSSGLTDGLADIDYGSYEGISQSRRRRRDEEYNDEGPSYDAFDGITGGEYIEEEEDDDYDGKGRQGEYRKSSSSSSDPRANSLLAKSIITSKNKGNLFNTVQGKFKAPRLATKVVGGGEEGEGPEGLSTSGRTNSSASIQPSTSGFVKASSVLKTKQGYTTASKIISTASTSLSTSFVSPSVVKKKTMSSSSSSSSSSPIDVDALFDKYEAMEKAAAASTSNEKKRK